jgi:acetolactate synthase I/III small subunit
MYTSLAAFPYAAAMTVVTPSPQAWTSPPTGTPGMSTRKRHIISILLQNEVGALTRVASLFATRGYNIESLSVAATDDPTVSRLTLVTTGTDAVVQQIVNQSLKLIDVVNVDDVTRDQHVERELLLIKLRAPAAQLAALQTCVHKAGGKVLSDEAESFTVELTDSESQINKFIAEAGSLGEVLEVVRSGALAMLRGATTLRA